MRKVKWMKFPLFVKWYITARCNLRCTHCYLTDYSKQSDLKSILKYVDYLGSKGVYQMNLLGGEPLVREDLELIIQKIKTYKMDLTIATNGLLATPERAKSLVASGAKKISSKFGGAHLKT
jgi:MoaA/NifB/PqqE/SkfB family radical SAM enzyme